MKTISLVFGFLACSLLLGCQTPNSPLPVSPVNVNSSAPSSNAPIRDTNKRQMPPTAPAGTGAEAWTLLDSRRMRLVDYTGKVVVLDFWATYCPPCVAETAHLVALQRQYGKQGVIVVGLNVGGADDQSKIADFVQQNKVQYDIGFPDGALVDSLMGTDDSIPQTFVFDRHGKLVKNFVGFAPATAGEIESSIQTALSARD